MNTSVIKSNINQNTLFKNIQQTHYVTHKKTPIWKLLPILLLLLMGMTAIILSQKKSLDIRGRAALTGPTLTLSPTTKIARIGESFAVSITMNTNTDAVSAVEFHLSYDPTAIKIVRFTPGNALPVILTPEKHTGNSISVVLGCKPTTPFKGVGIIGTWIIKVLTAKQSSISFMNTTQIASIGKNSNSLVSTTKTVIVGPSTKKNISTPIPK